MKARMPLVLILLLILASCTKAEAVDQTVNVGCSEALDGVINSDPAASATHFQLESCEYIVSDTAVLRSGDSISGPVGTQVEVGPALYGEPTAKLVGDTTNQVLRSVGTGIRIEWIDVSGGDGEIDLSKPKSECRGAQTVQGCPVEGTGIGIATGKAGGTTLVRYVYVHDNDAIGIGGANGRILNSHFENNTLVSGFLGWNGAAMLGYHEFEAAYNYIHDNQGNGIYSTNAHSVDGNVPEMASNPNGGYWHHDNVVVNNGRWGIRYEISPRDAEEGERLRTPTFQAESNRLAGNGLGGASMADAQNGKFISNYFGEQTIASVEYPSNGGNLAIAFIDSGRSDRTDLYNAKAKGNTLGGEYIAESIAR
jgi:Right handed beta helix region